eukprot:1185527-Rhodomonas_salina.1
MARLADSLLPEIGGATRVRNEGLQCRRYTIATLRCNRRVATLRSVAPLHCNPSFRDTKCRHLQTHPQSCRWSSGTIVPG